MTQCATCDGKGGIITERRFSDGSPGIVLSHEECPDCDGSGVAGDQREATR